MRLSALAQQKISEKAIENDRDFIQPDLQHTFMWDKETGKLTALDERSFNGVEQAIVNYYENRKEFDRIQQTDINKLMYENALFRLLCYKLSAKEVLSEEILHLIYRNDVPFPGPTGEAAIDEARVFLKQFYDIEL